MYYAAPVIITMGLLQVVDVHTTYTQFSREVKCNG